MNSYSGKTKGKKDADHKAAKAPQPKAVKEIRSTEEKDEILAVIAAAAAYMSAEGINGVVRSVRRSGSRRPIWALAGLMDNTHPF